ncbi:hypothetical protein [Nitrosopumilus sp.]|uniref:hypothetical protein n=1 Tax=Nitrosopumilus sp. TaxID=2024843 RepID=UPI00292F620F|nr:hypothetical protein [Nitrosopumilus sp.]
MGVFAIALISLNPIGVAFFALSVEERAKMIAHFMSMKMELESMSDEQKEAKQLEMKSMMEDLLPL